MLSPLEKNAATLEKELSWLEKVLDTRMRLYFGKECEYESVYDIEPESLENDDSVYAQIIKKFQMSHAERLIVLLALVPHIKPHLLDVFFTKNATYDKPFTEFGGIKGTYHLGFLPTCETAAFALAGTDMTLRFDIIELFDSEYYLRKKQIIQLETDKESEPLLSAPLLITREYLTLFTTGKGYNPNFSASFPASRLETKMSWEDLVVEPDVMVGISEIKSWILYGSLLLNELGMGKKIKRGFRSLFFGPPGTGKTLTASLLGKDTGLDVYRIDLSKIVSKYIGETEKNLAQVFDYAENKNWILFFDEADALFGKRTATKDSKDRHANQEVSFLLQRIEDFPGVVILATNLKNNMDEAFLRRFQSMIYFPQPTPEMRWRLWKNAFSDVFEFEEKVDLKRLSKEYDIAGGAINNVARYCALKALSRKNNKILMEDLIQGIRNEYVKEGKTV
jgi:adenylate kinase family enzyme